MFWVGDVRMDFEHNVQHIHIHVITNIGFRDGILLVPINSQKLRSSSLVGHRVVNVLLLQRPIHFLYRVLCVFKSKIKKISSDTHNVQCIKLHHFKLERFKSV